MRGLLLSVVCLSLGGSAAHAVTLQADADTYVVQNSSENFGSAPRLIATRSFFGDRNVYIRFDLGGSVVEPTVDLDNALLTLTASSSFSASNIFLYGLGDDLGDDWSETLIDGENAPGLNSDDFDDLTGSTLLGSFPVNGLEDEFEFSSEALDEFLNSGVGEDGLATFILFPGTNTNAFFASRENETQSGAVLTFDLVDDSGPTDPGSDPSDPSVIPLPASAVLLGAGIALLGGLRGQRRT